MPDRQVTPIGVPYPDSSELALHITVGACRLQIKPGDMPDWVSGSYTDPTGAMPLSLTTDGGRVRIGQSPQVKDLREFKAEAPTFDLALGRSRPFTLSLQGGAGEAEIDLGGVPITSAQLKYGAGRCQLAFSSPNPQAMSSLVVTGGAGGVDLRGLCNAGMSELIVEGGAASIHLEFGGELVRDATARITVGVAAVDITVPGSAAVKVIREGRFGAVNVGDGFMTKEGAFWTEGALAGRSPVLTVRANVSLGSLNLHAA
jgi:hypothetical protein